MLRPYGSEGVAPRLTARPRGRNLSFSMRIPGYTRLAALGSAAAVVIMVVGSAAEAKVITPERAEKIYGQRCAVCHGTSGGADGPAAVALSPRPRQFSDADAMAGRSDEELAKSITLGVPGTAMAPFGNVLTQDEIAALVRHIRTLAPTPDDAPDEAPAD